MYSVLEIQHEDTLDFYVLTSTPFKKSEKCRLWEKVNVRAVRIHRNWKSMMKEIWSQRNSKVPRRTVRIGYYVLLPMNIWTLFERTCPRIYFISLSLRPEKEKCRTKIHPYLRVWSIWAWHLKENFVRRVRARRMLLMIQPYNASDHDAVRMMLHLSTCHLLLQARGSRSALPGLWKTEPSYHFTSSYFYDEFHCRPWTFEPWLNPFIFSRIGLPGMV